MGMTSMAGSSLQPGGSHRSAVILMRVVFICNEYPPEPHGGIGTFVQILARALVQAGHSVSVVGWGRRSAEFIDCGVRVVVLRYVQMPLRGLINRWRVYRRLLTEIHTQRADLVETPDFMGMAPFRIKGCPHVVRLHLAATTIDYEAGRRPRLFTRICEYWTLRNHRDWIGVSRHSLKLTENAFGIQPRKAAVIYSPISEPEQDSQPPSTLPGRFVLFGGTVSERKGAYRVAEAALDFLAAHPDLHLVYAGHIVTEDGIASDERIREILGSQFASRVQFLGALPRPEFFECLRRADVFAFPSMLETFGLVVAEAMLVGTPVVTINAPPFDEFVRDGQTGLLVEPDQPRALAQAILRLLGDRDLSQSMGKRAREFILEGFSLRQALQATLDFYGSVLERNRTSQANSPGRP
jgi:glycosyltransferase involved in cell wall biosynthesis